jgi:hypothetical protein
MTIEARHTFQSFEPQYEFSTLVFPKGETFKELPRSTIKVIIVVQGCGLLEAFKGETVVGKIPLNERDVIYVPSHFTISIVSREGFSCAKYQEIFDKRTHADFYSSICIRNHANRKPFMTLDNGIELIDDLHPIDAQKEEDFSGNAPAIKSCFGRMKIPDGKEITQRWATNILMYLFTGKNATVTLIDPAKKEKTTVMLLTKDHPVEVISGHQWTVKNDSGAEIEVMNILSPYWKDEYFLNLLQK